MVKKITYLILWVLLVSACQNGRAKEQTVSDDSASVISDSQPADLKKFMDSLSKANGGKPLSVAISGTEDQAYRTDRVKANTNYPDLKTLNEEMLNQLLTASKKKYTLLHCWATWCGPCRKELPEFVAEASLLGDTQVLLVSFDYDSQVQRQKVCGYAMSLNTTLPVYIIATLDKTDVTNKESGVRFIQRYKKNYEGDVPYNVLIDNKTKRLVRASAHYKDVMASAKE